MRERELRFSLSPFIVVGERSREDAAMAARPVTRKQSRARTKRSDSRELAPRTVTQSNDLVQATYSMSLNEKRLILMAATQLDPRKPPRRDVAIQISAQDFAETWEISSAGHAYEGLADAAKRLYERSIKSQERNKRGDPVKERRWLRGRADYGDGVVTLEFNDDLLPYLTLLHERFTTYQLQQVSKLTSFYAIRLYELCAQYKKVGERYEPLDKLRAILDVVDKYPSVKDLRRWIIDPAMKEISETSDLVVSATPRRAGRKVIGFQFAIEPNEQIALPL